MKVAVIGAGFSGMLAAYLLEKEGVSVTVYEKNCRIGGHCSTLHLGTSYTELGTAFTFSKYIKELLLELQVDYSEQFNYRSFIGAMYEPIEQIPRENIPKLIVELNYLEEILSKYQHCFQGTNYGFIPDELLLSLHDFLQLHNLHLVGEVIAPQLSSFGFGSTHNTQAYYAFKIFNIKTINTFIRGEKLLFIKKGTSELIYQLSKNISDIRPSMEVIHIKKEGQKVRVDTLYNTAFYDKVLISTKLPANVLNDSIYNDFMCKIDTNSFITCTYESADKNLPTTYYKYNLGKENLIQFFHSGRLGDQSKIVAFAYGKVNPSIVTNMTRDIKAIGVNLQHLVTTNQWHIFPHLQQENLTPSYYVDLLKHQQSSNIRFIGSLICEPSLTSLYISVKASVKEIL